MKTNTIKATAESAEGTLFLGDDWFDPLEAGVRTRIRGFIEELLEAELDVALGRDTRVRRTRASVGLGCARCANFRSQSRNVFANCACRPTAP